MEEIIKQIAQIDSAALSNRKSSELALKEKKEKYEIEMVAYSERVISQAKAQAEKIYNQMIMSSEISYDEEVGRCRSLASEIQSHYLKIEAELLDEVFSELFRVEE